MLSPREWQQEPELFEAVADALEASKEFQTEARDEVGAYSERGYIKLTTPDGRRFRISLHADL